MIFLVGPIGKDRGDPFVKRFKKLGIAFAYTGTNATTQDCRVIRDSTFDFAAAAVVRIHKIRHRNAVRLSGVDAAGKQVLVGLILSLIDFQLCILEVFLSICLMDGRGLYSDDLASK